MAVYLDYNATAPVQSLVLEAMVSVYTDNYGNSGSRTHVFGQRAQQVVRDAREKVARLLRVESREVIFTSGATESNNLAILGLARWGAKHGRRHIVSTTIEHKAVLAPLQYLSQEGFEVDLVPVDESGRVDVGNVLNRVRPDTILVSIMHANNETGVIQPVIDIGESLYDTNNNTYFHIDAAQSFGKMVSELQVAKYDLLSISGHKVYGPQGIGALVVRPHKDVTSRLEPLMYGGGQELSLRPGTLPVALISGLGKASELAQLHHKEWMHQAQQVKDDLIQQLNGIDYVINGQLCDALPTCINISVKGMDSEALMLALKEDMAISNGSACSSASYEPSHVLRAMGLPLPVIEGAVRISWGPPVQRVDLSPLLALSRKI